VTGHLLRGTLLFYKVCETVRCFGYRK